MEIILAIGVDHHGFKLKEYLLAHRRIGKLDIHWIDVGCNNPEECDYPPYGQEVARLVSKGEAQAGVLICGTGIGMCIVANRTKGVYAGVAWNPEVARRAKEEDNVNVLVLPADYTIDIEALECVDAWLNASFKKDVPRYARRIKMIDK